MAVFSVKGGVGKSALAVNLSYASATFSSRRTLLWDLDAQGSSTYMLRINPRTDTSARKGIVSGDINTLIQSSDFARLNVLPADKSLRHLESELVGEQKGKTIRKRLKGFQAEYDRVVLDCPPGLTELAEQVFQAVDLLVVPMLPSPLSERAYDQLRDHLAKHHKGSAPAVLPVFTMVDQRKALHRATVAAHPDRLCVPYAAAVEAMATTRVPVVAKIPATRAGLMFTRLWSDIERALTDHS